MRCKHKIDRAVYFVARRRDRATVGGMPTRASEPLPPSSSPKRDLLVAKASELFYRDGYRAVGIDTLLEEAGVAKMTLYNHFASKEDLIIAVLQQRHRALMQEIDAAIAAAGRSPTRQLAAVFDGLEKWFSAEGFKGCAFIRALSEYPDPEHPIHRCAWSHKRAMNERLRAIAKSAEARHPAELADAVSLLIDGAVIAAHATGSTEPAASARTAALSLLKQATA